MPPYILACILLINICAAGVSRVICVLHGVNTTEVLPLNQKLHLLHFDEDSQVDAVRPDFVVSGC